MGWPRMVPRDRDFSLTFSYLSFRAFDMCVCVYVFACAETLRFDAWRILSIIGFFFFSLTLISNANLMRLRISEFPSDAPFRMHE